MIDGSYVMKIDTPFGKKDARVTIATQGTSAVAEIDAPVIGKQRVTGTVDGNAFTANGAIKVPFKGKIGFEASGVVNGNAMSLDIMSGEGSYHLEGARVS